MIVSTCTQQPWAPDRPGRNRAGERLRGVALEEQCPEAQAAGDVLRKHTLETPSCDGLQPGDGVCHVHLG